MSLKSEKQKYDFMKHIDKCRKIAFGRDHNSVQNQIGDLLYKDAIYRSFNEGLRLYRDNTDSPKSIIDLIHELYFENQVVAIRRLLDKGSDVYSLRKLIQMISQNRNLYTRENYVCSKSVDYEINNNKGLAKNICEGMHRYYDLISGVNESRRQKSDKPNSKYLEEIINYLDRPSLLHKYTDNYVTHAIQTDKRRKLDDKLIKVTLGNLQRRYRLLSWLCYTVSYYIGDLILFEIPTPQFDQFEGWCKSIYKKNINKQLRTYWTKRVELFKSWERHYWFGGKIYVTPYKDAH